MLEGYGRELFATFVPASARARVAQAGRPAALLSGALLARHGAALQGNVVEVTWSGRAVLAGVLRAVRHVDGIVAVSVPALVRSSSPKASRAAVGEILAAADTALY